MCNNATNSKITDYESAIKRNNCKTLLNDMLIRDLAP